MDVKSQARGPQREGDRGKEKERKKGGEGWRMGGWRSKEERAKEREVWKRRGRQ